MLFSDHIKICITVISMKSCSNHHKSTFNANMCLSFSVIRNQCRSQEKGGVCQLKVSFSNRVGLPYPWARDVF